MSIARTVLALAAVLSACRGSDQRDRAATLAHADAARLVGAWDVTFALDRPANFMVDSVVTAPPVVGTMAFTENRVGEISYADFGDATHSGVYDLDLSSFNVTLGGNGRPGSAVARTIAIHNGTAASGSPVAADSVTIALDPGDRRLSMRLRGLLAGDSAYGVWTAELAHTGAAGHFMMRRQRTVR